MRWRGTVGRDKLTRFTAPSQPDGDAVRTIGVISDTHGLLREEAIRALEGSDLILHAGDVGDPAILARLAEIAPVRAVFGNTDHGVLRSELPHTDVIDLSDPEGDVSHPERGPIAYMLHIREELDLDPAASGFAVVVTGHTHRPHLEEREGVLYFNPGAAGHRRFTLPVTVGRLHWDGTRLRAEHVELHVE